jgi:hypothetical protein
MPSKRTFWCELRRPAYVALRWGWCGEHRFCNFLFAETHFKHFRVAGKPLLTRLKIQICQQVCLSKRRVNFIVADARL